VNFTRADDVKIVLPRAAVEAVFDECDRYNVDETGGRILGKYQGHGNRLGISVTGIIEPGPNAQRTQTYFKQDGAYQEQVFRRIEDTEPTIEHLGNWHTHHVNGLRHLSGGDIDTYRRTVAHHNHNTDFFYALLVTEKLRGRSGLERYAFKNYVLRRGDDRVYEVPMENVTMIDAPLVWPSAMSSHSSPPSKRPAMRDEMPNNDLVFDQDAISRFFPNVKPFKSGELGIYWRGSISLVDGSALELVVVRDTEDSAKWGVTLRDYPETLERAARFLGKESFPNARTALIATERLCNAEIHGTHLTPKKARRLWIF